MWLPMTVSRLRAWLNAIPEADKNLPFLEVSGRFLTPRQMLSEAEANTPIGIEAQRRWEAGMVGTPDNLLEQRVRERLARFPSDKPLFITLGGPAKTPSDILASPAEMARWKENERVYLKYLSGLKEA